MYGVPQPRIARTTNAMAADADRLDWYAGYIAREQAGQPLFS